ncbi:FAD-dependent oxidoreductase [Patescibacteria group bacterium]|nr:FAD-dependent oxidoreductase [Patescibacteria group bacterium]
MPEYKLILKEKEKVARDTICCRFEKPEGFDYQPGQFLTLINEDIPITDKKGNRRSMSIASSPTEPLIHITMRIGSSAFKRSLEQSQPGNRLTALGPFGKFGMPADTSIPLVFLAGGIGITPFRSMLKYSIDKKIPRDISLFYSNSCMKDSAYLNELQKWTDDNDFIKYTPTMTDKDHVEPEWTGSVGLITPELLRDNLPDIMRPNYLIVGPPGFVEAMGNLLHEQKINEDKILIEKFTGY